MRRSYVAGVAVGSVLALLSSGSVAGAVTPTQVTSLSASVAGRTITVSGAAAFGNTDPTVVVEDATGDGSLAGHGLDITKLYMSKPDPATQQLVFTIGFSSLDDAPPETVQYNWDIAVDGGSAKGGSNWSIKTMKQQFFKTQNTDPYAEVSSCVPTTSGTFTCTKVAQIEAVTYDVTNDEIRLAVPLGTIKAEPGSLIEGWERAGTPVWARFSAGGVATGTVSFDEATPEDYRVPEATVELGIALQSVSLDAVTFQPIPFESDGAFQEALRVSKAGSYYVWARACYGSNCAIHSIPVKVV